MLCLRNTFLLIFCAIVCFGAPVHFTTPSSSSDFTTEIENKTDLPQEAIDEALNIDDGRYSTQLFEYQNAQKESVTGDYNDKCIDSYVDCITNQITIVEVCAWNKDFHYLDGGGYWNAPSYCEVQLDNCRRGYRVWRIFSSGFCKRTNLHWKIRVPPHNIVWDERSVWKD